jgi:hypothetical protein
MDEIFIKKVRSAAVAGWWTVLIAYCLLLFQWFAYLLIIPRQPAAMLFFWGKDVTWPEIRTMWLWAIVVYKLGVAMMIFVVIWLTLWARQLKKNQK